MLPCSPFCCLIPINDTIVIFINILEVEARRGRSLCLHASLLLAACNTQQLSKVHGPLGVTAYIELHPVRHQEGGPTQAAEGNSSSCHGFV